MKNSIDFSRYGIPECCKKQLSGYIYEGEHPSLFLSQILSGDICSILIADSQGEASFKQIVRFLDNEVPSSIWGSMEKFDKHLGSVTKPSK